MSEYDRIFDDRVGELGGYVHCVHSFYSGIILYVQTASFYLPL